MVGISLSNGDDGDGCRSRCAIESPEYMPLDYRTMSFEEIHDDLLETVNDLYFNAVQHQLEPLLKDFERIDETRDVGPSDKLVGIMEDLYEHDANLLNPRAQELMRAAVDEMLALAGA